MNDRGMAEVGEQIERLASKAAGFPQGIPFGENGELFLKANGAVVDVATDVKKARHHYPRPLQVSTLGGLVSYIERNRDSIDLSRAMLDVDSFHVRLVGELDEFQERRCYAEATPTFRPFPFDEWKQLEEFRILLLSRFVDSEELRAVVEALQAAKASKSKEVIDDGVAQRVAVGDEVTGAWKALPSPVVLRPWRTFPDVEQPASPFVLRVRRSEAFDGELEARLIPADGDLWRNEAVVHIGELLGAALADLDTAPAVLA